MIEQLTQEEKVWFQTLHVKQPDGCWHWTRYRMSNGTGHGQIKIKGAVYYSHRIAWELVKGAIPDGLQVCHKCDVPYCVNPDHMFLGTMSDNMKDKINKGRHWVPNTQLMDEGILEVFRLSKAGITNKEIGKKFNLNSSFISRILNGHRLRHESIRLGMIAAE